MTNQNNNEELKTLKEIINNVFADGQMYQADESYKEDWAAAKKEEAFQAITELVCLQNKKLEKITQYVDLTIDEYRIHNIDILPQIKSIKKILLCDDSISTKV